jgi:uncharacterized protein
MSPNRLPRGLEASLRTAWDDTPVAIVEGLRGVGKSTLVRQFTPSEHYLDLANSVLRQRVSGDLVGWLESLPQGTVVDEAQLIPGLKLAIKAEVDRRFGGHRQFLLTGSARLARDELGGSEPLVGRSLSFRLHPFAQCELRGTPRDVITALFDDNPVDWRCGRTPTAELRALLAGGGIPSIREADNRRATVAAQYPSDLFGSGVYETTRDVEGVLRLFRWIAGRSGQLRQISEFGRQTELARDTVHAYLSELQQVFLVESIPALRRRPDKRETDAPRLFVADSALVTQRTTDAPESVFSDEEGSLLETFVANELMRVGSWSTTSLDPWWLKHWRKDQKYEVDLVIERSDGKFIGIEVKASRDITDKQLKGLNSLRADYPDEFHRGFVIHHGERVNRLGDDQLWSLPFSALWTIGEAMKTHDLDVGLSPRLARTISLAADITAARLQSVGRLTVVPRIERFEQLREPIERRLVLVTDVVTQFGLTATVEQSVVHRHDNPVRSDDQMVADLLIVVALADPVSKKSASVQVTGWIHASGLTSISVTLRHAGSSSTFEAVTKPSPDDVFAELDNALIPFAEQLPDVILSLLA